MRKLIRWTPLSYFLILFGFFSSSTAYPMDLIEFVSMRLSSPSIQTSSDSSMKVLSGTAIGAGASLSFRLGDQIELETSVMYLSKNYSTVAGSGLQSDYSLGVLEYPVLVKFWVSEKFALGIGAYYSAGVGHLTVTQNSQTQILSYSDIGLINWEIGLTSAAQYQVKLNENMNLVSQARFLFGFTNLYQSQNGSQYTRDLQLWCGIGFKL